MSAEPRSVGHVERILLLRKARVVSTLPAASLAMMAEYMRERFFRKGSYLLRGGEPTGAVYYVVEGRVHLRRRGLNVGHAGPGSGLGELSLLSRDPDGVEARAEQDTLALELDQDAVLELFDDHFAIFHHILREMARQLIELRRRNPRAAMLSAPRVQPAPEFVVPERELDLVERIFLLRRAQPLHHASINALAELARAITEVRFEPDTTLWSNGYSSRGVYLIVRGVVDCRPPGEEADFSVSGGVPLGLLEALGEVPRWYDAVTRTPVLALTGDVEAMIDILEDNFGMAMDYLASLASWALGILERQAAAGEASLRAVHGCEEALSEDPTSLQTAPGTRD